MKKITLLFILATFAIGCKTQSNIVTSKKLAKEKGIYSYNEEGSVVTTSKKTKRTTTTKKTSKSSSNAALNYKIVEDALDKVGVKYRLGGTTKTGMDCSGLVFSTYGNYDISLPRTAYDMSKFGEKIKIKKAQPGDLIFFTTNGRNKINHVGIITEVDNDEIQFVHASTSSGVIVSSTSDLYYGNTFAQINRVIN